MLAGPVLKSLSFTTSSRDPWPTPNHLGKGREGCYGQALQTEGQREVQKKAVPWRAGPCPTSLPRDLVNEKGVKSSPELDSACDQESS